MTLSDTFIKSVTHAKQLCINTLSIKVTLFAKTATFSSLYNADIPKLCYYYNLPLLTTFSREACLGRIKYLPLLALSYSGIPVKELYDLFLWQITSKLNLILIVVDYQYIRQICIRVLIVSASCQQIASKLNYARRGMRLRCQNVLFVPMITPNT